MMSADRNGRRSVDLGGIWKCVTARAGDGEPPSDASWSDVVVPSNWHLSGLPNYSGTVFFRRHFSNPQLPTPSSQSRCLLRFYGVDYYAAVWLNDVWLGEHEGYFAPFEFEVT